MATSQLEINNSSDQVLNYWVVTNGYTKANIVSLGTLEKGTNHIALTAGEEMRIYVSAADIFTDQQNTGGGEPSGWSIKDAFSFFEYTWDGTGNPNGFSADMSYINDWAYPIQSVVNGTVYGFINATAIAQAMAAQSPNSFIANSKANGNGVGSVSDLFDHTNQRFAGPMQLWEQQVEQVLNKWPWPLGQGTIYPASWTSFLEDVPYGPGGNPPGWLPTTQPSQAASTLNDNNEYPEYGFDFGTNLNWSQVPGTAVQQPSGETSYSTNYNVWNYGFAEDAPSAPIGNIAPDTNAYTQILRAQAKKDGGMNVYNGNGQGGGNQEFVGFYTFAKDDYNANYQAALQDVVLTIGALAAPTTGTSDNDTIAGTPGNDVISGGYGKDRLSGGPGSAALRQALAGDRLTGQAQEGYHNSQRQSDGQDVFVYLRADSSLHAKSLRDVITDFDRSDRIDVAAVDANALRDEQQSFRWIGKQNFSRKAGQLRIDLSANQAAFLQGDTDGNGKPDFEIKLLGVDAFNRDNLFL